VTWWARGIRRVLRYNTVSVFGIPLKFAVLIAMVELVGFGYLLATVVAVEVVILHNFLWHLRWTWRDRSTGLSRRQVAARLLKFQFGAGAVAMLANLLVMRWLVNGLGFHYFPANMAATVVAGTANFLLSEFFVFLAPDRRVNLATVPRDPSCRT
jgi:putative flippase GtrA